MPRLSWLGAALFAFAITAVRAQDVGAGTPISDPTPAGVMVRTDVAYDSRPQQRLDLYYKLGKLTTPRPVIIYVHGGGWKKGGKADGRRVAFRYVAQGYAVVSIDYRLSGDATFPAQVEDVKSAVRWARHNAGKYGFNGDRIGLIGVSAGGHLAALAGALNGSEIYDNGSSMDQGSNVQAVVDFFGPVDLDHLYRDAHRAGAPLAEEIRALFGSEPAQTPVQSNASNPIKGIDNTTCPMLIVHGDRDTTVPLAQSRELYDALVSKDIRAYLYIVKGAGHTGPAFTSPEVNAIVDDFLDRTLKPLPDKPLKPSSVTE